MSEWQPIATAPKDGTAFLGLSSGEDWSCIAIVSWREAHPRWHCEEAWEGAHDAILENGKWLQNGTESGTYDLTHWMPLPEPPKDQHL